MNIPGIKDVRALGQKLVARLPNGSVADVSGKLEFFFEIQFEDETIMTVPITEQFYKDYVARLASQKGVTVTTGIIEDKNVRR